MSSIRSAQRQLEAAEFDAYLGCAREGLLEAMNEPERFHSLLDVVAQVKIERVLDVGCGMGQMLYPFMKFHGAVGVGLDAEPVACQAGREFYSVHVPSARVTFVHGNAEQLPFPTATFDVVNCGLALPYMNNSKVLDEVARVLRPDGIFLLRIHHLRYYLSDFLHSLTSRRLLSMIHASRVLAVGGIYHATGKQVVTRLLGKETFQTRWLLQRELSRRGFAVRSERPDSTPKAPAFVIAKEHPQC
jgi:ubiquinone/menaquinone biosynthesis C-methylase UbiE